MSSRRVRVTAVTLAMVLVVGACGDDDDSSSPFGQATDDTATSNDDGSSGTSDGTAPGDDSLADALDELPDDIGDIPGLSDECQTLAQIGISMSQAIIGGGTNLDELAADTGDLPDEIRGEVETVLDAMSQFGEILENAGIDLTDPGALASFGPEEIQAFEDASNVLDTDQVNAALDAISDYGERECDQTAPG